MKFNVTGYNIDNLLKILYIKKIALFNVVRQDAKTLSFEINEKDEKKVKRYIANFKVNKTPKFIKQLPKFVLVNLGVVLGVFLGGLFFLFASNFTWKISIYGTKDLTVNEIIDVLNKNGVKTGKINLQSSEEIESILLNNYDRIAQVSVIREGTHIIINLSEKLVYEEKEFAPIKAQFSGIITKINIISGTNNVKIGAFVNAGDVLVLPFNINSNGQKVNVKPLAEIEGNIFLTNTLQINKLETKLVPTGKTTTTYNYKLFNFNLFSGKNKNSFALFYSTSYNENISRLVPFSREVVTYYELAPTQIEHNFDAEKKQLEQNALNSLLTNLPQYRQKLSEKVTTNIVNDVMYATAVVELEGSLIGWIYRWAG